jgi:hypothetical protein
MRDATMKLLIVQFCRLLSPIALSLCAPSFATRETASNISDLLYMIVHLYETGTDR